MNPNSQNMFNAKHVPGSLYVSINELMGAMGNGTNPPDKTRSEALMSRLGIDSNTHVVIVGSSNNPFTVAGLWLIKYNGHKKTSYLNGGIGKWIRENRAMTGAPASVKPTKYVSNPDMSIYANADQVLNNINQPTARIVDVRSAAEYTGKDNPTQAKRTGHIPGAVNLDFYPTNLKQDGTFKSIDDLKAVYEKNGVTKDKEIFVYCAGGVRASVTQFVLKDILGYPNVKNYVGSWGEWGGRLDPAKYPAEK
jgi:thiosulfate/3-mercaptopyruvate sulfurtransferase